MSYRNINPLLMKLLTYILLKSKFVLEKYITCVTNDKHRIALTRVGRKTLRILLISLQLKKVDSEMLTELNVYTIHVIWDALKRNVIVTGYVHFIETLD